MNARRGFTLIEILLVAGIMAILSTGIFLALDRYQFGRNLELDAKALLYAIRDAQQRSITQEVVTSDTPSQWGVRVTRTAAPPSYFELIAQATGRTQTVTTSITRFQLRNGVEFASAIASSTIVFSRIGGIPLAGGTTTVSLYLISNSGERKTITIDAQNVQAKLF